ncbi:unnamed protein product [Adineta steineri]|uniref:G-protein coupled receptors family 1 profile domain-containing protein n=1 Tax=Adineta steineri TaxID=433720 RepID=A0A819I837_9BILA|nr:unnamed protein product [Adineta steineri]CAF3908908.1 unnamed protein product [Adineta steineri]
MSNNSKTNVKSADHLATIYYPLVLVIIGTLLNLLTLIIFYRSTFRNTKKQPVIHYMRAITIFDIFMLYGWNLDHYLSSKHGFKLLSYSIATCKIFGFLNYVAGQSSAWLRVFICFDRYLLASRLRRPCCSRGKGVLMIISCIIILVTLFNFHFLIFSCFYRPNGTIDPNAKLYQIYPLWNHINLGVYNCIPFIFMVIFNSGIIYHLIKRRQVRIIQQSQIQHRTISITLVITTFLFLIMTIPATIVAAFFFTTRTTNLAKILDSILYTYHITSFPLYLITFKEFRQEFIKMVICKINNRRIVPAQVVIALVRTPNQL